MSDQDIKDTNNAAVNANYFWVFLGVLVTFLSYFSRAYRSRFLLEPLGYKPKLKNVYHGVMAGYIINYTVPRSDEFARASLLANYENIPFEKVFGTIVVDVL
ncbi:MAG: flippase-like domain-containing protein [Crocinitomicaceae bacterium]|nr:flippase-like domain-containing protein [Crocinitomicaceae bacterium]